MIRVLLVDDHPVVRAGYARFLALDASISVVAEAGCADSGYRAYAAQMPDVTISDIAMPQVGGLELLRKILQRNPAARVLMCSMYDSPTLVRSTLAGGACGFVTKNAPPENLIAAVKAAHHGQRYLSDDLALSHAPHASDEETQRIAQLSLRELEIWRLLAQGHTPNECAKRLHLSPKTVANNQTQIKEKLAVNTPAGLVHLAQRHGVIGGGG